MELGFLPKRIFDLFLPCKLENTVSICLKNNIVIFLCYPLGLCLGKRKTNAPTFCGPMGGAWKKVVPRPVGFIAGCSPLRTTVKTQLQVVSTHTIP